MLAPSSPARAAHPPARREPGVDDRLAPPETRIEYLDGKKIVSMPADRPHGTKHSQIDRVVGAHVVDGYEVAVDMLTRTSKTSDFAPDVSIFPSAPDPKTQGRQLEEMAFEVSSKQALKVPTDKARKLIARGVRRVLCLLVKQGRLLEWSRAIDGWATVPATSSIQDPCLVRPLPVAALLDAARADDEVAEALLVKQPLPIRCALTESKAEGRREGKAEGRREGEEKGRKEGEEKGRTEAKAEAVLAVLDARGIKVTSAIRKRILAGGDPRTPGTAVLGADDTSQLDRWLRRAAVVHKASELFDP